MKKLLEHYPDFNFFMSPKFLKVIVEAEDLDFDGWHIRYKDGLHFIPPPDEVVECFVDYEGYRGKGMKKFNDNEYIYNSRLVYEAKGRRYKTFRHNVNKFKRENEDWEYRTGSWDEVLEVYERWLKERTIVYNDWLLYSEKLNFKIVYLNNEPVAFNIWDAGLKYIHYIFNYCLNIPYLNEFSRWLFYRDVYEEFGEVLVHDGGDMGIHGLAKYKRKLNPVVVRKRYGWC